MCRRLSETAGFRVRVRDWLGLRFGLVIRSGSFHTAARQNGSQGFPCVARSTMRPFLSVPMCDKTTWEDGQENNRTCSHGSAYPLARPGQLTPGHHSDLRSTGDGRMQRVRAAVSLYLQHGSRAAPVRRCWPPWTRWRSSCRPAAKPRRRRCRTTPSSATPRS